MAAIITHGGAAASESKALRGLAAVLLDVDGTLIDSNFAHAHAWVDALREAGVQVDVERIRWLIGMGGDKILPRVASIDPAGRIGQRIGARRREIFLRRYLTACQPCRGARALLRRLRDDGIRCVVASSARPDELGPLLNQAGVADLIDAAATSGDAAESKPDPEIVSAALRRARAGADEAIMVGDTPYDVEAAGRAGVRIIALRCGGWDDASLRGAVALYDHPADLLQAYAAAPCGARAVGKRPEP